MDVKATPAAQNNSRFGLRRLTPVNRWRHASRPPHSSYQDAYREDPRYTRYQRGRIQDEFDDEQEEPFNNGSYSSDSEPITEGPDGPVSSLISNGYQAAANACNYLIRGLSSALAAVAGPRASPLAINNTAKGFLVLLGLLLVQSILTFVLSCGAILLVLYASTQVFRLRFPFDFFLYDDESRGQGEGRRRGDGTDSQPARRAGRYYAPPRGSMGSSGRVDSTRGFPGGVSPPRRSRQRGKDDVIDVYFDLPPPPPPPPA